MLRASQIRICRGDTLASIFFKAPHWGCKGFPRSGSQGHCSRGMNGVTGTSVVSWFWNRASLRRALDSTEQQWDRQYPSQIKRNPNALIDSRTQVSQTLFYKLWGTSLSWRPSCLDMSYGGSESRATFISWICPWVSSNGQEKNSQPRSRAYIPKYG